MKGSSAGYQVSKWLYQRGLVSLDELKNLFQAVGAINFYPLGRLLKEEELRPSPDNFLALYKKYLADLKAGKGKPNFPSFAIAVDEEDVDFIAARAGQWIIKPRRPVIEVRHYTFLVTSDGRIQSLVYGPGAHSFGLQFAYPTMYINPKTHKIEELLKEKKYPNTELYRAMMKWFRHNTKPATLSIQGEKKKAPFRIGKEMEATEFRGTCSTSDR